MIYNYTYVNKLIISDPELLKKGFKMVNSVWQQSNPFYQKQILWIMRNQILEIIIESSPVKLDPLVPEGCPSKNAHHLDKNKVDPDLLQWGNRTAVCGLNK